MNQSQFWIDHFSSPPQEINKVFVELSPSSIQEVLEDLRIQDQKGVAFESAENRVFGFDDLIIKFYRPGRWSLGAIKQEVKFLKDLEEEGLDTVRPLGDVKTWQGIHYLAYKKVEKPFTESPKVLSEENVRQLSHLMAKVHKVGARKTASERPQFDPAGMCEGCFEVIKRAGFLPQDFYARYEELLKDIVNKFSKFEDIPLQRVHGDSYTGNVVWKDDRPILLDFDDFQMGPTAMDVKLLSFPWRLDSLPESMDRKERREVQQQLVLKFYREINEFPEAWEKIFPLMSAYRDIQFDAWFSSHWNEPGFAKNYEEDDITDSKWWDENMKWLEQLLKDN